MSTLNCQSNASGAPKPDDNEIVMNPEKLTADHQRLLAIINTAIDAIITIDERGVVQTVNPATKRLFLYDDSEVVGQNVSMLMPSPFREEHDAYMKSYVDSGVAKIIGIGREVTGKRKDGSTFPAHLAVSEIKENGNRFFTGIVRDISDLKKAEQELAELNAELEDRVAQGKAELEAAQAQLVAREKLATLGQVSGGIAHEIRNPLNAVKTSAYYLLNAKNPPTEKRKEHLERIDRQVMMIDNVVTALSDVAKLPDARMAEVCCSEMLSTVIQDVTLPNGVSVALDLPKEFPRALADGLQIPIVFRNLLRNARDAMPDGGVITIRGETTADSLLLHVDDTGEGIESAQLEKILEPLYSTKARGMGLGLAICKAILEKNGGELHIESQPGKGSRFTVELATEENGP